MSTIHMPHYENVPFEVPKGWVWTTLGDIFTLQAGKNITAKDIYDTPEPKHCFPCYGGNGLRGYVSNYNKEGHHPLIGRQGALCGNINEAHGQFYATEHAVVVETYCETDINWVINVLVYLNLNQYATSTAQPGLSVATINEVAIPLPPIEEQKRISKSLDKWFSLIDIIENEKDDLQTTIKQTKSKILDLAIHGKLVPQDPNDEPAIELLKRINPDFTPCDNGHSEKLPQGWSITELTNLADIKNGYAFKSSNYISSNGVRLIRIANVQDGYIEDKMPQFYPFDKMKALKDFMLTEGDILMSLTGNVGRVGILTNELLPAALNQRVACIKEHPNIIAKKFLFYTFQTSNFSKDCVKSGKGVAQLNISTEWLKHYFILIPPLTEQQRIVQKIEELFSVLDNIQNALEV